LREGVFFVIGGNAGRAARVDVHKQDAAAGHIGVGGRVLRALLDTVVDARQ
jgi:hypothetical protein